jgi:hypothetical protein
LQSRERLREIVTARMQVRLRRGDRLQLRQLVGRLGHFARAVEVGEERIDL